MKTNITGIANYFLAKPKTLFLVDGFGGALTALSLFFVLRNFQNYFGMPVNILTYLAILGLVYCTYSIACYFFLTSNCTLYLRIIGVSNLLYCVLTLSLLRFYYNNITQLGFAYFLAEVIIILMLVYIELRVANVLKDKKAG